jgi:hypothetical protein
MKKENGSIRKELSQRHQGTKNTEERGIRWGIRLDFRNSFIFLRVLCELRASVRNFGIMVPGTVGVE